MPVLPFNPNAAGLGKPGGRRLAHRVTLLLVWLIGVSGPVRAEPAGGASEPEYLLRAWGPEQGLPENSANAIAQTRDGFLWFGTWNGWVRFNGHRFTAIPYKKVPREKVELPERPMKGAYDDQASLKGRKFVAEKY